MSTPRFDSPQQEAFLAIWRTYDRLRAIEDELFQKHGLTAQQYNALRLLNAAAPGSLPTLALQSRLISRAADITRLVDRLAQLALVSRSRPAENRRLVEIAITPAGQALLHALRAEVIACHSQQLGHLSPDELSDLIGLLRRSRKPHEADDSPWK